MPVAERAKSILSHHELHSVQPGQKKQGPKAKNMVQDDMAIQDDGKILLAGEVQTSGPSEFGIVRYIGKPEVVVEEPTRKADVRLGMSATLATGNNVHNPTGNGPAQPVKITSGKTRTVQVGIQNDGTAADTFKVKGTAGNKNFAITYLNGTRDVTASVVAGKFTTSSLDPGELVTLKAKIKAKTTKAGKDTGFSILATSNAKTTVQDKAIIKATSKAKK